MNNLQLKSAYVEITSKCNLYCRHCYNNSSITNNTELATKTIKNLYEDFANNNIRYIALSGGEPFLHTNIQNILDFSEKYSIDTQIVTNGVLIANFIEKIHKNPYLNFQISIDGIGEIHDKLRGKPIFDIVDKNIDLLKQCTKYVVLKATINKFNIKDLKNIIEYSVSKKISKLSFSMLNMQGRAFDNNDIFLSNQESREVIRNLNILTNEYKDKIEITPPKLTNTICPFLDNPNAEVSPRIDVIGNIYLCSMFVNPMFRLGNIYHNNVSDIIKSCRTDNVINFLHSFYAINECRECYMNSICSRGCPAQYLNTLSNYVVDTCSLKKDSMLQSILDSNKTIV